jgi:hypothetical protein
MQWVQIGLILSAGIPVGAAWWANRKTALVYALFWGILAWLAWLFSTALATSEARYIAASLTACAGAAVLGARRPGATAWNGVVLGLLAVLLLPLAQASFTGGEVFVNPIARWFLTILLVVVIGNYFPTRLLPGALALLLASLLEVWEVHRNTIGIENLGWPVVLASLSPWLAAAGIRLWKPASSSAADQLWQEFRDSFGAIWALRLQDQFNHSTQHLGLELALGWNGVRALKARPLTESEQTASLELLVALLQRFGLP